MRWGVPEEASDDHSTSSLCLAEVLNCQKLSTGPNFVVNECYSCVLLQLVCCNIWQIVEPELLQVMSKTFYLVILNLFLHVHF